MDRVTRRPLFGVSYAARSGLALDGDTGHIFRQVGIGSDDGPWQQDEVWPADPWMAEPDMVGPRTTSSHWARHSAEVDEEEAMKTRFWGAPDAGPSRPSLDGASGEMGMARSSKPQGSWTSPEVELAVDREQIDFYSARQQFLTLERANSTGTGFPPRSPSKEAVLPLTPLTPKTWNRPAPANTRISAPAKSPRTTKPPPMPPMEEKRTHRGPSGPSLNGTDGPVQPPPAETPIEREIRLAQEREADLREQRGLQRAQNQQELVQIRAPARQKQLLLGLLDGADAPVRPERGRVSLYVQRDLEQETQREAEHRQHRGLPRPGSRAPSPDWPHEGSSIMLPLSRLRRTQSSDSILDLSQEAPASSEFRKVNRIPASAYQPFLNSSPLKGRVGVQAASSTSSSVARPQATMGHLRASQGLGWDSGRDSSQRKARSTQVEGRQARRSPRQAHGAVLKKEYFFLRPLRFRVPDVPSHQEIHEVPAWRLTRSSSSELLEKEVEEVLRREQALKEERLNALYPEIFSKSIDFDGSEPTSRSSSRASGTMGSYSVSESFSAPGYHSGVVWSVEDPSDEVFTSRKDQWYAGLNPADHVNSQVLESTWVPRHKSFMAQRWESGHYANKDEN
ncbi:mitotic interactor and substrate of PLK1 [Suncus etruscus]|uniref:mitotic interactor and substrate of PLK1 n=1 Tax=Suncus etruscus TaxID=109475 RepID=UPI00211012DC|nr:mitotic interactor and substrate of PLK1 [Suncus etruscus]